MHKFTKKHLLTLIGVTLGAAAGFLYWKVIGCATGSYAITSDPVNSTVYGAVMGGLLLSMFKKNKNQVDASQTSKQ